MIPSRMCSLSRIAVVALALTVALPMAGAQAQPLSALYLYYNERVLEGTVSQDSGANMKSQYG